MLVLVDLEALTRVARTTLNFSCSLTQTNNISVLVVCYPKNNITIFAFKDINRSLSIGE